MSTTAKLPLLSETFNVLTSNLKGVSKSLPTNSKDLIFQIAITRRTAGDITAVVEHSLDKVNWYTLVTFTAAIASVTAELQLPTTANGGYLRSSVSTPAGCDLDAEIDCWYNPARG